MLIKRLTLAVVILMTATIGFTQYDSSTVRNMHDYADMMHLGSAATLTATWTCGTGTTTCTATGGAATTELTAGDSILLATSGTYYSYTVDSVTDDDNFERRENMGNGVLDPLRAVVASTLLKINTGLDGSNFVRVHDGEGNASGLSLSDTEVLIHSVGRATTIAADYITHGSATTLTNYALEWNYGTEQLPRFFEVDSGTTIWYADQIYGTIGPTFFVGTDLLSLDEQKVVLESDTWGTDPGPGPATGNPWPILNIVDYLGLFGGERGVGLGTERILIDQQYGLEQDDTYADTLMLTNWAEDDLMSFHAGTFRADDAFILGDVSLLESAGSPEGAVTATVGSIVFDKNNGNLYVKQVGTSSTDWREIVHYDAGGALPAADGSNLTNLNASRIQTYSVDNTDIADTYVLAYNSTSGNLEYEPATIGYTNSGWGVTTPIGMFDQLSDTFEEVMGSGVLEGGHISQAGANTITVSAGEGYIAYGGYFREHNWLEQTIDTTGFAEGGWYVYIDQTTTLQYSLTEPDTTQNILLGNFYHSGVQIAMAFSYGMHMKNFFSGLDYFFKSIGIFIYDRSGTLATMPGETQKVVSLETHVQWGTTREVLPERDSDDVAVSFFKWFNSADDGWEPDYYWLTRSGGVLDNDLYNDVSGNHEESLTGTCTFTGSSVTVTTSADLTTEVVAGNYVFLDSDSYVYANRAVTITSSAIILELPYAGTGGTGACSANTAIVEMTDGKWGRHIIGRTLDGNLHFLSGNAEYDTEDAAIEAGFPVVPTALADGNFFVAAIVFEKGETDFSDRFVDMRPLPFADTAGGGGGGAGGGVSDHGVLNGLTDDDHTQYLLVDGTRAMTGGLDMGTGAITNVGNVDGVDVSAHAARHQNGGADEIDVTGLTGLPVTATDTAEGLVELATQTEVNTGTDTGRVVTPATLANTTLTFTPASHTHLDADISDTLTIGSGSTVDDGALSSTVANLGTVETITADWVNTANPWADNEVSDTLTVGSGGSVDDAAIPATIARDTELPDTATTTTEGIVELATQTEVNTGTDTSRVVTPETLTGWTMPREMTVAFGGSISTAATTWVIGSRLIFPGTDYYGTPTEISAIINTNNVTRIAYWRIYDSTNSLEIATGSTTSTTFTIVTDSTLTNLPTGQALFEFQIYIDSASADVGAAGYQIKW